MRHRMGVTNTIARWLTSGLGMGPCIPAAVPVGQGRNLPERGGP